MQDTQDKRKRLRGLLDPVLLRSTAVLITGGTDNKNMPLVTFSVNDLEKHSVTSNDLQSLLKYNLTYFWGRQRSTCPTFAALANLSVCSKETIVNLIECLDAIQSEGTGSVGAAYIVSPMNHSNQKVLRKLLGVYPSKKYKRNSLYKVVVVADDEELAEYVDFTQLTPDFGGYLLFSQHHFITFSKNAEELEDAMKDCLHRCPTAEQELMNITEQTEIKREEQMAKTLLHLRHAYHTIARLVEMDTENVDIDSVNSGLKMELLIDKCKEMIEELARPDEHTGIKTIKQHPLLTEKREILSDAQTQLLSWRQKLQRHWQMTETQIVADARLMKNEHKIRKIQDWISTVGIRHVKKNPPIASSSSEANILCTHFNTSFYSTAKRVVWLAHKLADKIENILDEKRESNDFSAAADRSEQFVKGFKQEIIYFDHLMEKKSRVFQDVVDHFQHQSSNSDAIWMLDATKNHPNPSMNNTLAQMASWYEKVLRFLPVQLLNVKVTSDDFDMKLLKSSAWTTSVHNFTSNHPMPWAKTFHEVKRSAAMIQQVPERKKARKLIQRVELLNRLLQHSDRVTPIEMNDILRWRKTVLNKSDDYVIRFSQTSAPHRVLQLQKIAEQEKPKEDEAEFVIIHPGTARTQSLSKKTADERYVSLNSTTGNEPKLPRSLNHIDHAALTNNEPQIKGNLSTKKAERLTFGPVDLVTKSDMTTEEKMAALTAFCEPEVEAKLLPKEDPTKVDPTQKSVSTESEMSTLSEESYVGVDIEKWIQEGQLDLEASGEQNDAGYLDDLKLDASEVHLARLRLESEEIIQDSIEQSLSRTMDMLQMSGKKCADEDAVSGSDESGFFTLMGSKINPASLEIMNKFCEEEEQEGLTPKDISQPKQKKKAHKNPWLADAAVIPTWLSNHQNKETFEC